MNLNINYSKIIFQTEYGNSEMNHISSMNNNSHQYCLTNQLQSNKQKLLDFISDKNKLILKTYFDHKGAKEFLIKKNEALERIELNSSIEDEDIEKNKRGSKHKNKIRKESTHKSPKHRKNMKSLNKENTKESLGIVKIPSKKKKNKHKSSLNVHKYTMRGTKDKNKNDQESNGTNMKIGAQTGSIVPKCKNKLKIGAKNSSIKLRKNLDVNMINNTELSLNSECSGTSKIFIDKNDYKKFKNFMEKDDSLVEEIITELESNIN